MNAAEIRVHMIDNEKKMGDRLKTCTSAESLITFANECHAGVDSLGAFFHAGLALMNLGQVGQKLTEVYESHKETLKFSLSSARNYWKFSQITLLLPAFIWKMVCVMRVLYAAMFCIGFFLKNRNLQVFLECRGCALDEKENVCCLNKMQINDIVNCTANELDCWLIQHGLVKQPTCKKCRKK